MTKKLIDVNELNIQYLIKLHRSLIAHFWLAELQFMLILQNCHFYPFRFPNSEYA